MARRRPDRDRVLDIVVELARMATLGSEDDPVTTVADLESLVERWVVTDVLPPSADDLNDLRRLRRRCLAVFRAKTTEERIAVINDMLTRSQVAPRLIDHDELGLHMHYFRPYCTITEHLRTDCAMALALFLADGQSARLKVCVADDCGTPFIDRSNNRSRMYCDSQTCGNRLHAAAYRSRLASREHAGS